MAEEKTKRAWPYLLGGVAVGAAIGFLFAKKPGNETREELKDWLSEKREQGRELIAEWKEKAPFRKREKAEYKPHHEKEYSQT